jgi:hypothetical protein
MHAYPWSSEQKYKKRQFQLLFADQTWTINYYKCYYGQGV